MSLQFILGGSGSGKSHELYKKIYEASVQSPGTQFLVIVPEQFTMQTQKEIVRLHPKKGIMNIDVLSFQRLSHRIFEEVGADKRTVLEEMGKTLLLRRTATKCQDQLKLLSGNLKKKGYLAEVKSLISELTQYDIDEVKMEKMLVAAKEKPQLYYKLNDIKALYAGFKKELEGKYITAEETLDSLCQVADRSEILKNCVIALDGFTGFTPIQYKLLKKLLVLAKEVYVTVTIDPRSDYTRIYGEHELFYLSKRTIHGLSAIAQETGCEIQEAVLLKKDINPRFSGSEELAFLEKRIFRSNRKGAGIKTYQGENKGNIQISSAANPARECHIAAREIRRLIQEGYRYQDIAIIVGNMEAYETELPYICEKYQIPVFMDSTRAITGNPFVEFLCASLDMLEQDYSRESVFRVFRTGFSGLTKEELDTLENYVCATGIKGRKAWQAPFFRTLRGWEDEKVRKMEALRVKLMAPFLSFHEIMKGKNSTREKTKAMYELCCAFHLQKQLKRMEDGFAEAGKADLQKEYSQVYKQVIQLFDKIVELLGEEALTLKEYTEILQTGLEELKVGIIPPTADLVQVGNLERTRLKDIKVMFFLGLNDGFVPAAKNGGGLLTETERETLSASKVELAPGAREESYIQKFYLYLNLTKPSQKLYLSFSRGDMEGNAMRPSYILPMIEKLFPEMKVQEQKENQQLTDLVSTPESSMQYLLRGMQTLREKEPDPQWMELYNWYRRNPYYEEKVQKLLDAVFSVFTEDAIGKEAARELYGEVLENSVTRLERFASCAFAHFLEYGLGLQEREEYAFKPTDMGTIVHKVVELFVRRVQEEKLSWRELTDEKRNQLIDECVDMVTGQYGTDVLHSTKRNEYMITRIRRIMRRTAWALQKQIEAGSFYPANTEVSFAQIRNLDAVNIALSDDEKMHLQGRIDRIDICEKEDQVYVKVIDYKSGNTSFDLVALYYGLQLQLVVYLNAATELEKQRYPEKEIVPAGIFYYHVKDPVLDIADEKSPEEINQDIIKELKLNGLVNEDPAIYREMDQKFEKASDIIPVSLNKDGTLSRYSKIASSEQFHMLSSYVSKKMRNIGQSIMNGEIASVPYERDGKTGCDYCIYKEICRLDKKLPGTHSNKLKDLSAEDIWKQMEMQEIGNKVDERTN